ncbi:hypothetical protein FIV00_00070 [Labrenzia sp. THAF82]|uniref:hypothetical protein n=1 Tax=Labrenzia sp. THAF82 TaxID=2587861 RepID=UPI0012685C02|nr:hypothetical protein [Labrenzia sp. THAF82]QFT28869.1 hypothetical protein FIV00_00070 [Labrenzia sp. THAF82]
MSNTTYHHERLNTLGQVKKFALQAAVTSGLATVGLLTLAGNANAPASGDIASLGWVALAATLVSGAVYKMIPVKIIQITVTTGTRVRVQ